VSDWRGYRKHLARFHNLPRKRLTIHKTVKTRVTGCLKDFQMEQNKQHSNRASLVLLILLGMLSVLLGWWFWTHRSESHVATAKPNSKATAPVPAARVIRWRLLEGCGRFLTSLTRDHAGNIWVGTEDEGVFRCTVQTNGEAQVTQFTTKDGLGDNNAYAMTCDRLGRVWVGHLNHGVSVFNGETWRNYDVTDGPLGERVFCMATCPTDSDVWIGTSAGLARYSPSKNILGYSLAKERWRYYTRADGLPSDQISAIAFDKPR